MEEGKSGMSLTKEQLLLACGQIEEVPNFTIRVDSFCQLCFLAWIAETPIGEVRKMKIEMGVL